MYALVDAVSMYASAEKVFDPKIRDKPVLVLSNNDGCVIAACPIAKRLGLKNFVPYFQIEKQAKAVNAVIRSSNYALYADLSSRMMDVCAQVCPDLHIYSIDECFLKFDFNDSLENWMRLGDALRRKVWKEVRLPVGVGFGPTPTLAKAANHASKKVEGFNGVAVLDSARYRRQILTKIAITDVWGVGKRLGVRFNKLGLHSALDLANQCPFKMGKQFSVVVENTVRELNGEIRLGWDDVRPDKKELFSSRSFGERIADKAQLRHALTMHAQIACKKLRHQKGRANSAVFFAASSPHDANGYYKETLFKHFARPTADTRLIIAAAHDALHTIYKPGVNFYKCGVGLLDLVDETHIQEDLFSSSMDNTKLMGCLDAINTKFGRSTLQFAAVGTDQKFHMKQAYLSPRYTTRWSDVPRIKC
ncbi:Y-family DNA polymerase [Alteromonas sp. ASW11-130]|uniref:Y-family DNA polymerase n=1 Tax=Alteromonas sp. ASW11-130 TaxID=3015775 RepID=UPI0022426B37|nr:Y-family DNA polymerase [Alteromonas sp. ASW11-130]MCW8092971.1 Y-family DNA polymerase [Alteromonas sp. ASW11-130]